MYAKIETKFWNDPTVRRLSEDARSLFIYLLTSPQRNMIGLFHLPAAFACYHLQWINNRFEKALKELTKTGRVEYDEETELILILNFFKYQPPENPNQIKAALEKIEELPTSELLLLLAESIERIFNGRFETVSKELRNRFETVSKGFRKGSETVSKPDTDTDTEADTDTVKDTDTEITSPNGDTPPQASEKISSSAVNKIMELYNSITVNVFPEAKVMTEKRAKLIRNLIKKRKIEIITMVFQKAAESNFLCGRTKRPFNGCNFDWIIDESHFVNILEGKYDNGKYKEPLPPAIAGLKEANEEARANGGNAQGAIW